MNLNMLLKLGNLICAYADFAKFIYKTFDICSQQKKKKENNNNDNDNDNNNNNNNNTYMYARIHICLGMFI